MGGSTPALERSLAAMRQARTVPPVHLHRIEALAARLRTLDGPARSLLEDRLGHLQQATTLGAGARSRPPAPAPQASGLALLVEQLDALHASRAAIEVSGSGAQPPAQMENAQRPSPNGTESRAATLPVLQAARQTWARLRMEDHLRHVMAEVPDDAGPMHSTVLVHRAIAVMHGAAPEYLAHFLGYADALAGLERISPSPATTPAPRPPRPPRPASPASASGPGKAPRPRSRGRRRSA